MATDSIATQIERERRSLLDLTLRNHLLNYRLPRARGVEVTGITAASAFDMLVKQRRKLSFLPMLQSQLKGEPALSHSPKRTRHQRLGLQSTAPIEELRKRLLKTYYDARTFLEEQGINALYIALGMVHWYESDRSDLLRKAPLILVPVTLSRSDVNTDFIIEYDEESVGTNLSFLEKIKHDFGLNISDLHEINDEDDDEIDVEHYYQYISQALVRMPRWSVDRNSVALGIFSFQKLLMYHDLSGEQWSLEREVEEGVDRIPIISSLFRDGFADPGPTVGPYEGLDKRLDPVDLHHVVDADSSQAVVIADVSRGRNLVVQGPPGTGKSQTIVNLIADAISQHKTVLFVSEKMAALEVVKRRLDNLHIGDACLELHSHKTTKRAVLDELRHTMQLGQPHTQGIQENLDSLVQVRDKLNGYADAVDYPFGETGVTPHDAMGSLRQIEYENTSVEILSADIGSIESWSKADFQRKRGIIDQLQLRLHETGVPEKHLFWCTRLSNPLLPQERRQIEGAVDDAVSNLQNAIWCSGKLSEALNQPSPQGGNDSELLILAGGHITQAPDYSGLNLDAEAWKTQPDDLESLIASGERLQELWQKYDRFLLPEAWNADLRRTREVLSTVGNKFWRLLSSNYRRHRDEINNLYRTDPPKDMSSILDTIAATIDAQNLESSIRESPTSVVDALGSLWNGVSTEWRDVAIKVRWYLALEKKAQIGEIPALARDAIRKLDWKETQDPLRNLVSEMRTALEEYRLKAMDLQDALDIDMMTRFGANDGLLCLPFTEQAELLRSWSDGLNTLDGVISFNTGASLAQAEGLENLVTIAKHWRGASGALVSVLDRAWYESVVSRAFSARPDLRNFNLSIHLNTVHQFVDRDRQAITKNSNRVAHTHWEGLPPYNAGGDVSILRREFEKKSRNLPIRQLIQRAGHAIQAIKPVFMMSPLSIANFIPPGALEFDIVVFDEASQVKPVDAIGALLRGKQAVIVGDTEQMPPTTFFDNIGGDDDDEIEPVASDMESILGLFRAQGAPVEMLRWHYRSRHESLIALSNHEFYDGNLLVFASPDFERAETGLRYHYLPETIYDRSINRGEAAFVAEAIMQHAKSSPDLTLGVAAFSIKQAEAIRDELERLRKNDQSLEAFFNAHSHEPFFVKNLESVQGDERDVIFISVGYGRNATGQVSMNFGPLNQEGGHRRLNVLITRARLECHIFTNLQSTDIALDRTNARGVKAFKAFLHYTETGEMARDIPTQSGRDYGSPFQSLVASAVRSRGFTVHEEVASGGKFIDIAVVDPERPGRYILGIEFDGASYHSARWARDRDRLRDEVLTRLGWRLHRIWSTDYFNNPEREIDRAVAVIEQASASRFSSSPEGSAQNRIVERADHQENPDEHRMPPYIVAEPIVRTGGFQLGEVSPHRLVEAVAEVVLVESPVHVKEVARRLANAAGVGRMGSKIQETLNGATDLCVRSKRVVRSGDFLWDINADNHSIIVRDRSALPPQARSMDLIAPEEIGEAIRVVVERSVRISRDEAATRAASLMGFERASRTTRESISAVLGKMIDAGALAGDELTVRLR